MSQWDTQRCLMLQKEILSSPRADINSTRGDIEVRVFSLKNVPSASSLEKVCADAPSLVAAATGTQSSHLEAYTIQFGRPPGLAFADGPHRSLEYTTHLAPALSDDKAEHLGFNRSDKTGFSTQLSAVATHGRGPTMSEASQTSNSSLTQKNPDYVYAQFNNFGNLVQKELGPLNDDGSSDNEGTPATFHVRASQASTFHASARNQSPPHTYDEDDTGHVNLGAFTTVDASHGVLDPESEDAGQLEPQTPALPTNPFRQKGSVLKGFELFGATQPSSVGRYVASPTSSRPSPDVYSVPLSPRRIASSPLARVHGGTPGSELKSNREGPFFGSNLNVVSSDPADNSTAPAENRVPSPASHAGLFRSTRQPRSTYVPLKESQERRQKENRTSADRGGSDESDSDFETRIRKNVRRKAKEKDIQRELAAVELQRPDSSDRRRSSASGVIEIPSTGRRHRAMSEEDPQAGNDADTRDDDPVIIDSQPPPKSSEVIADSSPFGVIRPPLKALQELPSQGSNVTTQSPGLPSHSQNEGVPDLALNSQIRESSSDPAGPESPTQEESLPLQEFPRSSRTFQTPISKSVVPLSDPADGRVPETSPVDDRIRPLTEIASISFTGEIELEHIPCLTQDSEFENAIKSDGRTASQAVSTEKVDAVRRNAAVERMDSTISVRSEQRDLTIQGATVSEDLEAGKQSSRRKSALKSGNRKRRRGSTASSEESSKKLRFTKDDRPGENSGKAYTIGLVTTGIPTPNSEVKQVLGEAPTTPLGSKRSRSRSRIRGFTASTSPKRSSKRLSVVENTSRGDGGSGSLSRHGSATLEENHGAIKDTDNQEQRGLNEIANAPEIRPKLPKGWSYADEEPTEESFRSPGQPVTARKHGEFLFKNMAFAVSYVKKPKEKDSISNLIAQQGGRILEDGFECLFELPLPSTMAGSLYNGTEDQLTLTPFAKSLGFAALIADEHSRKAKYMQALALGLPCISGRWILACVEKGVVLDWAPYLLCAGQSSFLGGALRSRILQPYPAVEAKFSIIFEKRTKIFESKSILMVVGKNRDEKRKTYVFLTRVLGPSRLALIADVAQAKRRLLETATEECGWDWVYVDSEKEAGRNAIFESKNDMSGTESTRGGGKSSRKRKNASSPTAQSHTTVPNNILIINDETIIQSLILGQLVE
ncbi:hypothetical protein F5884DRAFT_737179 [Xylogone sp. PMI_703]|nr:hypothetical protein F5884DRAFT_737179 [Xylogone sp. PMI_703]